ncbi:hypothetical protein DL96DRAFT_1612044 [Flagelloscypha sp. PMI_526]|nr:hypothetical protein DL96DRAFT_1612044 [Flagelloscypha sp. PMI_526]
MRSAFVVALASFSFFSVATAQGGACSAGSCWENGPSNATDHGCQTWEGGVDAWQTCGFEACYTSPNQATGAGCNAWHGGTDAWEQCGFEGAITCRECAA